MASSSSGRSASQERHAMSDPVSVGDYLSGREDLRRRELVWGVVREPPAPRYGHQAVVTRTTVILDLHVRTERLGIVCVSPIDVVLDEGKGLIVQPDVIFISQERTEIVRGQVWGAPDLVVEVISPGTAVRDRTIKLEWYRRYAVREYWLVDPARRVVIVVDLTADERTIASPFAGAQHVRSSVLPGLTAEAQEFFA
jgi:Uma2 family endonuclease